MTVLHGAACAGFCFGPIAAIYKATNLSDQTGTKKLLALATAFYFVNLFGKSLIVATLLPSTCESSFLCSAIIDLVTVVMELTSIKYILNSKKALAYSSETRLLCIGLGWALGQVLCSNGHLLLRAIGGNSFHWEGVYQAMQSSLSPISYLSITALMFLSTRRHLPMTSRAGLVFLASLLAPWTLVQRHGLGLYNPPQRFLAEDITPACWLSLVLHAAVSISVGITTYLTLRAGHGKSRPTSTAQKTD
ncbi:hypothetical protein, conserved [Eimeria necatrix]|uniref:BOS complex subunit TMEM147 n=1 Tax=Eimeria necatrix TaxID=51315 RepID=U6MLD8_9EIME|nr:hypothetical protein, conserved [Eimeria necatrix]CDJ63893.1 hypothetical protein, conserved [Eimeria necatrix]